MKELPILSNESSRPQEEKNKTKTFLDDLRQGHQEFEVWADGHPAMFAAWCREKPARERLNPAQENTILTGVTTNPRLLTQAIQSTPYLQERAWAKSKKKDTSPQCFARLLRDESIRSATKIMRFQFEASKGRYGWVSAQVNPHQAYNADAMIREGEELASLAPNIMVKLPATSAGFVALENLTAKNIATNTTLSTTASQAQAALRALERGEGRRKGGGSWRCVLTFMAGRLGATLSRAHPTEIDAQDARKIELLALETQHNLVHKANSHCKLLVCSLRADTVDRALGTESAHLAAALGRPWVLTCPTPFMERVLRFTMSPIPLVLSEEDRARLCKLPMVQAAFDPNALPMKSLLEWPALVQNREEHIVAHNEMLHLAQHLRESLP